MIMTVETGIAEDARKGITEGLEALLADSYTLYVKTHNYHWNVTGPMFQALHAMFEDQYNELALAVDEIAERIRALGFFAPATFRDFTRLSSIDEDTAVPGAMAMVANLVSGHEAVVRTGRPIVERAEAAGDVATADLVTARIQVHEKTAWMLRAMLEDGE